MKFIHRIGIAVIAVLIVSASQAATYAVCIGINKYATPKDANGKDMLDENGKPIDLSLVGAVNDAREIRNLLVGKFSVPSANTKLLLDAQANGQEFVKAMRELIGKMVPGDTLVFSFSGHGIQTDAPSKASGKMEFIVLSDLGIVADDFFRELSVALVENGMNGVFIFDSCHAGGMSMGTPSVKSARAKSITGRHVPKASDVVGTSPIAIGTPRVTPRQARGEVLFVFSSTADELSIDAEYLDGSKHGAFTFELLIALNRNANQRMDSVIQAIRAALRESKLSQTPNLLGTPKSRESDPLVKR
ncbi:MAG: caspase family protein [Fimbriimonadales bacterium]|nr:caspase family protein [Fimbriimonadales bacterium]